jgi:hypothetical protein
MKKQNFLVVAFLCIALDTHAQTFEFRAGNFTVDEYLIELPYQNVNDKIIVEVDLNGKKRRFLLDTGAPLAISQKVFEELKPTPLARSPIRDINGKTDSLLLVRVDSLKIGDVYANGIPALVLNDNPILTCLNLDGFLGSNVLRNSVVQFDSKNQVVRIADQISKLPVDGLEGNDMLLDKQASPFLKLNLGKKISEYVIFDSGSDVFYSMAHGKIKKFKKSKDFTVLYRSSGSNQIGLFGVAERDETAMLAIPVVELNGAHINKIISETSNNSNSRIGSGVLAYGTLTLDYKMKKSYFKPFEANADFLSNPFELNPTFINNKLCVGKIWTKELAKLTANGDEIISVDGIRTDSISLCDAIRGALPKNGPNRTVEIKKKDGSAITIQVEKIKWE